MGAPYRQNKIRLCITPGTEINPCGLKSWMGKANTIKLLEYSKEDCVNECRTGEYTF